MFRGTSLTALAVVRSHAYSQTGSHPEQDLRLATVYVPTNHVYVGDIYMLEEKDITRTNLSVREGLGEALWSVNTVNTSSVLLLWQSYALAGFFA